MRRFCPYCQKHTITVTHKIVCPDVMVTEYRCSECKKVLEVVRVPRKHERDKVRWL